MKIETVYLRQHSPGQLFSLISVCGLGYNQLRSFIENMYALRASDPVGRAFVFYQPDAGRGVSSWIPRRKHL